MKKANRGNLPAMILLFFLMVLWQLGAMKINAAYILPSPLQLLSRLWELRQVLFTVHLPATMGVTALGLAISVVLGVLLALIMDASPLCRKTLYPLVVASQTIPTTAIAPLFVLWFGYGIWSKVLVTVLITFFPIAITVYDGLQSARVEMAELLLAADMVLTDYSTAATDFILKDKPALFFVADWEEYISTREVYYDVHDAPFLLAEDQPALEALIEGLTEEKILQNCADIRAYFGITETGHATDAVCDYIIERMKG